MGRDDPQIPMNPPEFMLAPHSMTDAKYNLWGSGVSYAEQLLEGLEYEEYNITYLMPPSLFRYMLNLSFLFSLFFFSFLFFMTSNVGNCNRGDLLSVSPLILHISLGRFMLMVRMALLRSMSCPIILTS